MVEIYIFETKNLSNFSKEELEKLFPIRYKKAMSYKKEKDQYACLGAGILLHSIIGLKESEIKYTDKGKPYSDRLFFSISHTDNQVYVITSDKYEVGIDIECEGRDTSKLEKVFHPNELERIKENRFSKIDIWTRKEALLKYLGTGLVSNLSNFDVSKPVFFQEDEPIAIYTAKKDKLVISAVVNAEDELSKSFKEIF